MKVRLKKYKGEINKLKDRIKNQNHDIDEAIQQLMLANKEKENTKSLIAEIQEENKKAKERTNKTGSNLSDNYKINEKCKIVCVCVNKNSTL